MTKLLKNVEVFSIGKKTDSSGVELEFNSNDLDNIIKYFDHNKATTMVPLKLGHTNNKFNNDIAKALNLPTGVLTGEAGKGAAKLGQIVNLYTDKKKLFADIELANDDVANLITKKYFDTCSMELGKDGDTWYAQGIAFLGAQNPAVKDLAKLQEAVLLSQGYKYDKLVLFELNLPMVDVTVNQHEMPDVVLNSLAIDLTGGDVDKLINDLGSEGYDSVYSKLVGKTNMPGLVSGYLMDEYIKRKNISEDNKEVNMNEFNKKLAELLKVDNDEAKLFNAVDSLIKAQVTNSSQFSEMDATVKGLKKQIKFNEWRSKVVGFTNIAGKPDELAEKLVTIESIDAKAAQSLFEAYETQNKLAAELNTTKASLTPSNLDKTAAKVYAFETKMTEYAKVHNTTPEKALGILASQNPLEFAQYKTEKLADLK